MPNVIMTVGCPGAGKTTWAQNNHPDYVVLSLDDFRLAMFREKRSFHDRAQHNKQMTPLVVDTYFAALRSALGYGFNLILANTHVRFNTASSTIDALRGFGIKPDLKICSLPLTVLLDRNRTRPEPDRVPEWYVSDAYKSMSDPNAWWKSPGWNYVV